MRRWLWILLAVLSAAGSVSQAQQDHIRLRWASRDVAEANGAPTINILTPSPTGTHQTTGNSAQITGIVSDDRGVTSVTWACATCSPTSGVATITGTSWDTGEAGMGSSNVATDTFTVGTTIDLTAHNAGYAWSTLVDSAGGRPNRVDAGTDTVKAFGTADSVYTVSLVTPSPALSGASYTVSARVADTTGASANAFKGLIFGASDANNYCGVGWYGASHSGGFDLAVFKRESSAGSNLTTADINATANDIIAVTINGTAITVTRGGTMVASTSSTFCDNATGVGLFFGNASGVSGDDQENSNRIDDFVVTDNGASGGIGLAVGANTIVMTATDAGALTGTASIVVTRAGADTDPPVVTITSPTASTTYATSTASFSPAGDVTDNVGVMSMSCTCATCTPTSRTATVSGTSFSLADPLTLASGANTVTCTATDAATNNGADTVTVTYTPSDVTAPTVTITTNGGVNFATSTTPTTLDGTCTDNVAPTQVSWSNAQGGAGIATGTSTWSASIALITGTNNLSVTCRDEAGNVSTADTIVATLNASSLAIVTTSLLPAVQNVAYSQPVVATGGELPYTWDNNSGGTSLGAGACTGLSINASTGYITGTPTTTGACNFTARVTDNLAAQDTQALTVTVNAAASGNDYFNTLIARGDYWKSLTLRETSHFLGTPTGYAVSSNSIQGYDASYDATMDAGRTNIVAFHCGFENANRRLTSNIGTSETSFTIIGGTASVLNTNRDLKIDNEIMDITVGGLTPTVVRGTHGTTAASHTTSSEVCPSNNSQRNQLHWAGAPGATTMGTEDGYTYLFTWDTRLDSSFVNSGLTNYKWFTFQDFVDKLLEVNANFVNQYNIPCWVNGTTLIAVTARSYNTLGGPADWAQSNHDQVGPGITKQQPIEPGTPFCSSGPNKWIRIWVRIEQRANDYDYVDMWVADESQAAVRVLNQVPMSVWPDAGGGSLKLFRFEWGTSTDGYVRGSLRDFIGYYRNLVVLRAAGLASAGTLSDAGVTAILTQP